MAKPQAMTQIRDHATCVGYASQRRTPRPREWGEVYHVDKLLNYIRYWQASGESIKTSVRTKTRLEQLTESGFYTGGSIAYGYRLISEAVPISGTKKSLI